MFMKIVYWLMV